MRKLVIASLMLAGLAGCAESDDAIGGGSSLPLACTDPTSPAPVLDAPFNIHAGEDTTIASAGLTIGFVETTQDTRCPQGLLCLVAGQADVLLTASRPPESTLQFTLSTRDVASSRVLYAGYVVRLVGVLPAPVNGRPPIAASDYCVRLVVTRVD